MCHVPCVMYILDPTHSLSTIKGVLYNMIQSVETLETALERH